MKVGLEKSYPIPATPDVVWSFLQNIEGVARCMPGARITERLDEKHFKGTVAVKVGPASMSFKGDIEVRELDEAQRMLRLIGKGSDSSGTSGASMDLTARVETGATAGSSNLIGKSDVSMSGKAAAFGGRMMATVADQILNQFAANFAKEISAVAGQAATAATNAAPPTAQTPGTAHTPPGDAAVGSPDTTAAGAETANEINALALLWAIIRDWFRGLFRRKPA
jgi:carbon monoxide dehydrogenase subunit G